MILCMTEGRSATAVAIVGRDCALEEIASSAIDKDQQTSPIPSRAVSNQRNERSTDCSHAHTHTYNAVFQVSSSSTATTSLVRKKTFFSRRMKR